MYSLHTPTACGGIGGITPSAGAAIPIMAGAGTAGTARVGVGASVGAAGTEVGMAAGGDTTTIIIPDFTPVDIGEDTDRAIHTPTAVLRE
jgi:hypothetical protein